MNIVHKPRDDRLSHPFRIATEKTAAATSTRSCNCCYVTHLSKENINYAEILARYIMVDHQCLYPLKRNEGQNKPLVSSWRYLNKSFSVTTFWKILLY